MNLTATKPRVPKAANHVNGHNKTIEPFYIDRNAEREYAKTSTNVMEKLNRVCNVWQSVTGKAISSEEEFKTILEDPAKHWRSEKFQENVEQKKERTLSLIDEGYAEDEIQKLLKLPADFDEVFQAVKEVTRIDVSWKTFTWVENGFQLSQYHLNRVDGQVYFHAVTPLQQKRLAKAKAVLAAIKDLEEVMIEEAEEAGIKQATIEKAIKERRYIGPLPYCLKSKPETGSPYINSFQEITINEQWVVRGLAQWADMIGLSKIAQKDRPAPKPHVPMVYLKYLRTDGDGARRLYIVPKHQKDDAYIGGHEARIKFLPGEFVIEPASGKLIPNE